MLYKFTELNPVWQALAASLFAFVMTSLGSAFVYIKRRGALSKNIMLAFSAGIMTSSSFFSLLLPALETIEKNRSAQLILPAAVLFGAVAVERLSEISLYKFAGAEKNDSFPLLFAIFLHNIPEGLAIGAAFAYAAFSSEKSALAGALALSFGIGLQDLPEGAAVSLPLFEAGKSRSKAFFTGAASALGEPVGAAFGALLAGSFQLALPLFSAFAAGAMLYAVAGEMLRECLKEQGNKNSLWFMTGFCVMMVLDSLFI